MLSHSDTQKIQSSTRNKSITSKAMQYRQDIVTRMPVRGVELITISIVTIRSIWHNQTDFFLHYGKFPLQICESCDATYRRNYEMFSALQSTSGPLNRWQKQSLNPCITGDAILHQTGKKLTEKCGPEVGDLLWCHLMPHRTRSSADADNRLDAFSGQSRSTNMVPFHMLHILFPIVQ